MKVRESTKSSLSVLCLLLGFSRQAYYKQFRESEREAGGAELVVQEVLRHRQEQKHVGVRKLHDLLQDFMRMHDIWLGRDALFDLLRVHCLLVRRRRSRKPRTTFSAFWMKRYPNLAKEFIPIAPNQLWVSDITYIRIGAGFGYLSLITDAYSRKIVGYHLSRDLSARGCVAALEMALRNNPERDDRLIHHSDRGLQYYSEKYLKLLGKARITISMSEKSDPRENAIAERMNGILKCELLERRYQNFADAERAVARAASVYNHKRPHMSVDKLTPAVAHTKSGVLKKWWKKSSRSRTTQEATYAAL